MSRFCGKSVEKVWTGRCWGGKILEKMAEETWSGVADYFGFGDPGAGGTPLGNGVVGFWGILRNICEVFQDGASVTHTMNTQKQSSGV